ncbi:DUF397 domain-containing protein [Embleya sp. NPDC050493]|uniref:DUF397 domain-containing protein n=1 Tax=Embleya sp. NPDC050493 TaxID=3363989 RepID=UPI0037A2EA0D
MTNSLDVTTAHWRKSTHSGGNSECVEAAGLLDQVGVRDTKDRTIGHIAIPAGSWNHLVRNLRNR